MRHIPATLAGALLLAGSLAAVAQEPAPSSEGFGETIDVRVVNLEAVVTDRQGKPVRGLTAADFRLLVNGREFPIDLFTEVVEGEAAPAPPAVAAEGSPAAPSAPAATGRITRNYLMFLDDSFSIAAQRNAVLNKMEKGLELLGPGDRMALVVFDGSRLEKLSDWTNDRAVLVAAFAQARKRKAGGNLVVADRRSILNDIEIEAMAQGQEAIWERRDGGERLLQEARRSAVDPKHHSQLARAVDAAAAAVRGFPPPPEGRKLLLLLAGGWPDPGALFPLIRDANRLGYTVYPVDVPGSDVFSAPDLAYRNKGQTSESGWERGSHASLEKLAAATGGRAALDTARLDAFRRMVEDTSSYYWLGFTPDWKADDRNHTVQLEVRRPGLSVRSRSSYSDLSQQIVESLRTETLLLFGEAGAGRDLQVKVWTPKRTSFSTMEVPVSFAFPARALDVKKAADGWEAEGVLYLGALDVWGDESDLPAIPLRLRFREEPGPDDLVRYRVTLNLRRAKQRLVLRVSAPQRGSLLWKTLELGPEGAP